MQFHDPNSLIEGGAQFTMRLHQAIALAPNGDIGLNDYPIFDGEYRAALNEKIIRHYYNQEIGMESIALFRLAISRRMHEEMPYYNQLYLSTKLEFDPLRTVDMETDTSGTSQGESNGASTSTSVETSDSASNTSSDNQSRAVNSAFPQLMLSGNGDYATDGADSKAEGSSAAEGSTSTDGTSSGTSTDTNTGEFAQTSRVFGFSEYPADLLMRYRAAIVNVDRQIIDMLSECFMGIWSNGDARYQNSLANPWYGGIGFPFFR